MLCESCADETCCCLANICPLCIVLRLLTPRRYRSTCRGLSAASGKAGAILGVFAFGDLKNHQGFPMTFGMLAIFMFFGLLCTYFVSVPLLLMLNVCLAVMPASCPPLHDMHDFRPPWHRLCAC